VRVLRMKLVRRLGELVLMLLMPYRQLYGGMK